MITSFFKTSKPFHFIITAFFMLVLFVFYRNKMIPSLNWNMVLNEFLIYLVLIFTIAVLSFVVAKNNLTKQNSFSVILFALFLGCIPETLMHDNILISNVFVLLAIRRLVSLKSNISVKKKLFDAAFWLGIASLFYFWSILFFGLIFIALLLFALGQLRNWLIPFIAIIALAVILSSYSILFNDSFFSFNEYFESVSFSFKNVFSLKFIIGASTLSLISIIAIVFYVKKVSEFIRVKRSSFLIVLYAFLIAFSCFVIAPSKNGSEVIFMYPPLAIITSNFLETIKNRWFSDFVFYFIFGTVISVLVL